MEEKQECFRLSNAHFKEAQGEAWGMKITQREKNWLGSQPLESMVGVCV